MSDIVYACRNALSAGLFFGFSFGLFMAWNHGWLPPQSAADVTATAIAIIVSGGLFGLIMGMFASSGIVPKPQDIAVMPGDAVEHSGLANHFLNFEGRGGRLALTSKELVFMPHVANVQRSELRIPRSEIAGAVASRTLGVVPNGLKVTLKSGRVERFVVNDRATWVAKLSALS